MQYLDWLFTAPISVCGSLRCTTLSAKYHMLKVKSITKIGPNIALINCYSNSLSLPVPNYRTNNSSFFYHYWPQKQMEHYYTHKISSGRSRSIFLDLVSCRSYTIRLQWQKYSMSTMLNNTRMLVLCKIINYRWTRKCIS